MTVGNYVNRKSGNVVKVVEVDEKTKTLIYEGADGKTHATSWSSFRKSYKSEDVTVNEEPKPVEKIEEKQDSSDNIPENTPEADEKSAEEKPAEKPAEKVEKPKEKKERKKRDMSAADDTFNKLCGIGEKVFNIKTWEKIPRLFVARNDDGKSLFEVRVTSKGITFNFRKEQTPDGYEITRTQNNYYMPEVVVVEGHDVKMAESIIKAYKKEAK